MQSYAQIVSLITLLALILSVIESKLGVDVADKISLSTFRCMKNNGYEFAIIRAFHSYGAIDTNAIQNLKNAQEAGLQTNIYMFPCRGKSAESQVQTLVQSLSKSNFSTVWVDVETNPSSGCSWKSYNASSNCQYLSLLASAIKAKDKNVGIYSSKYMWQEIFGDLGACIVLSRFPLWYAHYDKKQSFSDFTSFGGWKTPTIKQYDGDTTVCGIDADKNYYP